MKTFILIAVSFFAGMWCTIGMILLLQYQDAHSHSSQQPCKNYPCSDTAGWDGSIMTNKSYWFTFDSVKYINEDTLEIHPKWVREFWHKSDDTVNRNLGPEPFLDNINSIIKKYRPKKDTAASFSPMQSIYEGRSPYH